MDLKNIKSKKTVTALTISTLICTLFALYAWQSSFNRLALHDNWISQKDLINAKGRLPEAKSFITSPLSIRFNDINLGSFNGHQKITFKKPVIVEELEATFFLTDESVLYFNFNENLYDHDSLRLSLDMDRPSAFLKVSSTGAFTNASILRASLKSGKNYLRFQHLEDKLEIRVNDKIVLKKDWEANLPYQISFKGDKNPSGLSYVKIKDHEGNTYKSNFFNSSNIIENFIIILAIFSSIAVFIYILSINTIYAFSLQISIAALAIMSYCFTPQLISSYNSFQTSNVQNLKDNSEVTNNELTPVIKTLEQISSKNNDGNTTKALIIGDSQTLGTGVSTGRQTWIRKYCDSLNLLEQSVECYNASVSELSSDIILKRYQEMLIYEPDVVFFVIGEDPKLTNTTHKANYAAIFGLNASKSIETVVVLKPWRDFQGYFPDDYIEISEAARTANATIINAPRSVDLQKDSGHIWWDKWHMTDYGHSLMAKIIFERLDNLENP